MIQPQQATPLQAPTIAMQLTLTRKDFVLDIDVTLPAQGVTVVFGPSGSGKTTLLRCVAGLERAKGRICIQHTVWQDSATSLWTPPHQREVGYVFQEASLFEHLNIKSNLQYGVRRVRKAGAQEALDHAIQLLGIGHLLQRSPATLSGGERQRVAIARALATQPAILLLDEPLASLDSTRRQEILPWLEQLHQQLQIPVLYVTHSMEERTRLADYVLELEQGKVRT